MAGVKETFEIELNPEQMAFIQSAKEQYGIASEDKVVRIIMDYIQTNPGIQESVFTETRCLRCE